jgi:hypothetical protein
MLETRDPGDRTASPSGASSAGESPQFLDWLRSGRLTLVDASKRPLSVEAWADLPTDVRAKALSDFRRVVSPNAKAAVIFLRS